MAQEPAAPTVPTKVCPHCGVQSQTTADKCPSCGKRYKVKKRHGCLTIIAVIVLIVVVAGVISSLGGKSKPVTAADVTQRVGGSFVRSGCLGCGSINKIQTSHVYCGWDGSNVIVHVVFSNSSSEILKVNWHPSYSIRNGTSHGTGLTSLQETNVSPGGDQAVFNKQSPAGTTAGTPIAKCDPSFFNIQAG